MIETGLKQALRAHAADEGVAQMPMASTSDALVISLSNLWPHRELTYDKPTEEENHGLALYRWFCMR